MKVRYKRYSRGLVVCIVALAAMALYTSIPIQTAQAAPTTAVPKTTASTTQPDGVAMYRMYNMRTGEHLYTADANEKNVLKTRGWDYEGIGWYAPKKSSTPVYRLYSKRAKAHHYTTDKNERDVLSKKYGWTYEGVGWYSDDKKTIPIYRVYKASLPLVASHHFTYDKNERDTLVAKHKYKGEGVAWHALAEGQSVLDGWEKVDGKWRFYNEGTLLKDRWVVTKRPFSKKSDTGLQRYRIDAQGNLVTGFFKVDGASYYGIPAKGHVVRYSYKIDSTHALVADADGKLCQAKGWVVTNKLSPGSDLQRFYFEPIKANKKYIGARIGDFKVSNKRYYGIPEHGYVLRNALHSIGSTPYYANNGGVLEVAFSERVPQIYQNPELPTGCESVALTMVLRAYGFSLGKTTIVDRYLSYSGYDFVNHFVGNPRGSGAGIYAPGLTNTANRFLKAKGSKLRAHNISGRSFESLVELANSGTPVLVWSTMYMNSNPHYSGVWASGRQWYNYEHCVVLRGSSGSKVKINDSLSGSVNRSYTAFRNLYYKCGSMAVAIW